MAAAPADWVQAVTADIVAVAPRVAGAVIVLLLGWILGRIVAGLVRRVVRMTGIDRRTRDTPIGRFFESGQGVSRTMGLLAAWFVYAVAVLAAADILAIRLLSQWLTAAVSYLPALFGGILFILIGVIVADMIADMIRRTEMVTGEAYVRFLAAGVRALLYVTVVVIGLDTIGVDVAFAYLLAGALVSGIVLAAGIGIGIALGLGGKDYVANHIEEWLEEPETRTGQHD